MLAELTDQAIDVSNEAAVLAKAGVRLVNHSSASGEEATWVRRTFNALWAQEASAGWNWFAKDADGKTVGFACYEQRSLRFWWVKRWLSKPDVGIFGPVGVDPALRERGLGCLLVRRALRSLHQLGYARALIPRVASAEFYERCCGAHVVERLRFLGIF